MSNVMMRLSAEDFTRDPHAVKYGDQLQEHRSAFERLFLLLNDPANEQRLIDAESFDKPALAGVVRFIEADPKIASAVESNRFRQTVGVAVKLKKEKLGWEKTGKKGTVTGARHFVSAERYTKRPATESAYATAALNALKAVSQIGDDREREETGRYLMEALATTRRESGRVFCDDPISDGDLGGDGFSGAWSVTEYVHDPDGTYRGTVAQRRRVEQVGEARLRVTQQCEPSAALDGHAMAAFAGEWVFDLEVAGSQRRYLGPDVVGSATQWQPGAMTGAGLWPRFGYEFESYSVLVAPDRQLTGGFFSLAGRSVADIVGVAVPEAAGVEPRLDLSAPPPEAGDEWQLHRAVGPLLVATGWPAPAQRRRLWAMNDPLGATGAALTETVTNDTRSVAVTIG